MSIIKNLLFDFGGVFAKIELQGCVEAFRSLGFKDVDEYLNPYQQKGFFGDLEAGRNTNPFITSWFRSDKFDGNGHGIGYYIPQEHQYLSFEQKCMKPGREIFEKMLSGEGFVPDETMFVDDGAINLNTAKELGLHTFQPLNGENWGCRLEEALKFYK